MPGTVGCTGGGAGFSSGSSAQAGAKRQAASMAHPCSRKCNNVNSGGRSQDALSPEATGKPGAHGLRAHDSYVFLVYGGLTNGRLMAMVMAMV